MKKLFALLIPDIERLSVKDSKISTKRYADLRIVNHFIWMSWTSQIALIYYNQWSVITYHLLIVGSYAFLRGVLATDFLKNFLDKK